MVKLDIVLIRGTVVIGVIILYLFIISKIPHEVKQLFRKPLDQIGGEDDLERRLKSICVVAALAGVMMTTSSVIFR